jgi:S-DNA-T family DNA segregation ATPase FtsK/SpoIIIE
LPRIDGDLVVKVTEAWTGPAGPQLRLLPGRVDLADVREQAGPPADRHVIGLGEKDLAPVTLDPAREPHLLVLGDSGSGRSTVLRTLAQEVMRTRTPAQAQILLVDYRRALLGAVPQDYLLNYVTSATQAIPALREVATYLEGRIPGPDVTAVQVRDRSWWSGAELFVLVDDYDLVATSQGSPVAVLQPLLAQARDVGLHLAVARRCGGASRALYEPVIQSLRDLATPGLLLSGNPDEGPLIGNLRPAAAPPGRGRLVTRDRGVEVVQLAWSEPAV